jgi:hypothetical protein
MKNLIAKIGLVLGLAVVVAPVGSAEALPGGGGGGGGQCVHCSYHWFSSSYTCENGGGGSGCIIKTVSYFPVRTTCAELLGPCGSPSVGGVAP